jgi:hypothetical protein
VYHVRHARLKAISAKTRHATWLQLMLTRG